MQTYGAPPPEGTEWRSRRCAYAVLVDDEGRVATVQAPLGWFLPGGGADPGEQAAQTVAREVLEELGMQVHDLRPVVQASEWWSRKGRWLRFDGSFFAGRPGDVVGPGEDDHTLCWLTPEEAQARITREAHRVAVRLVVGA